MIIFRILALLLSFLPVTIGIGGNASRPNIASVAGRGDGNSDGGQSRYLTHPDKKRTATKSISSQRYTSPIRRHLCEGWQENSYVAQKDLYVKTLDTMIASATPPVLDQEANITGRYNQTLDVRTTFDLSTGAPLGIISASVGIPFARSDIKEVEYTATYPAGAVGRVGFTPQYLCTMGTLTDCDGKVSDETETCTPWLGMDGSVHGDYTFVM